MRQRIVALKREKQRIADLLSPVSVPIAAVEQKIDLAVAEFTRRGLITEALSTSLLYTVNNASTGSQYLKPETIVGFLCLILGENNIKTKIAEEIKKNWPGETISETDRTHKIAAIDQEIFNSELEEEQFISSVETLGGRINRRGDLDPRVFLEFKIKRKDGESQVEFKIEKLRWLGAISDEADGVTQEIHRLRENLISKRSALQADLGLRDDAEHRRQFGRQLEKVIADLKELNQRYEDHGEAMQAWRQLQQACYDLLFQNGLDREGNEIRPKVIRDEITFHKSGGK